MNTPEIFSSSDIGKCLFLPLNFKSIFWFKLYNIVRIFIRTTISKIKDRKTGGHNYPIFLPEFLCDAR